MSGPNLLHYSTTTTPATLEAGTPEKPAPARIDLTVSSPSGQQIYCQKIDIAVPAGTPEGAYFTEKPKGEVIGGNWSPLSFQMKTGQELGLATGTSYYQLIFEPPIPEFELVNEPLQFRVSGTLAASGGSGLNCFITEYSDTTSGSSKRRDPLALSLPTVEPVFYLHNFLSTAPDKPTVPRTRFNAGDTVRFSWESNGSYFQLYDGDGTTLYEGPGTFCTVPQGKIVNDTTFTLKAVATSGTQQSDDSTPAYRYATLTVTITNPTLSGLTSTGDIAAKSRLAVDGQMTANGGLTVNQLLTANDEVSVRRLLTADSGLTTNGTLNANGSLYVSNQLSANGGLSVDGHLSVDGTLDVRDKLTANGGLTVEDDCQINTHLHANSDLTVYWGPYKKITTGSYNGLYVNYDLNVAGAIHKL